MIHMETNGVSATTSICWQISDAVGMQRKLSLATETARTIECLSAIDSLYGSRWALIKQHAPRFHPVHSMMQVKSQGLELIYQLDAEKQ